MGRKNTNHRSKQKKNKIGKSQLLLYPRTKMGINLQNLLGFTWINGIM